MLNQLSSRLQRWLGAIAISDANQRRQAANLQVIVLFLLGISLLFVLQPLFTGARLRVILFQSGLNLLRVIMLLIALWLLRRGRLEPAVVLTAVSLLLSTLVPLYALGLPQANFLLGPLLIPLVLVGLLAGQRTTLAVAAAIIVAVVGVALLQQRGLAQVGFGTLPLNPLLVESLATGVTVIAVAILLDRFSSTLRDALAQAQAREQELEALRGQQESIIEQRTTALASALADVSAREGQLVSALNELRRSQETIRGLSVPVIRLMSGLLMAPLIGVIDTARAKLLEQQVLQAVERNRAAYLLLDVTGVPLIDTQVARVLLDTAAGVRLLGAEALLVGIHPEVAQSIAALGMQIELRTFPDVQSALEALLRHA